MQSVRICGTQLLSVPEQDGILPEENEKKKHLQKTFSLLAATHQERLDDLTMIAIFWTPLHRTKSPFLIWWLLPAEKLNSSSSDFIIYKKRDWRYERHW